MTRLSKQQRRRKLSPRRPKLGTVKTGPKKDALEHGYKVHENALTTENNISAFIPKIK